MNRRPNSRFTPTTDKALGVPVPTTDLDFVRRGSAHMSSVARPWMRLSGVLGLALPLLAGCITPSYVNQGEDSAAPEAVIVDPVSYEVHEAFHRSPPKCIAILPFTAAEMDQPFDYSPSYDFDDEDNLDMMVAGNSSKVKKRVEDPEADNRLPVTEKQLESIRRAFYSQLAPHGTRDIELMQVDAVLHMMSPDEQDDFRKVGLALGCDAIMIGSVIRCGTTFLGIYSRVSVGADVKIVRAWDGEVLWEGRHIAMSHGGSVPISPFAIPMTLINAITNVRGEQHDRVTGDLARRLVGTIPDERDIRFVTAESLNFRVGPGFDYDVVTKLSRSDSVEVIDVDLGHKWATVRTGAGETGFVSSQFLSKEPVPAGAMF